MPSRVPASEEMPDGADRFYRAISGRARVEVLRHLWRNSSSASPAIADAAGLPMATVRSALTQLEELGYIEVSPADQERRGRAVTYALNRRAYEADYTEFQRYLNPR